jgi:hypothetical protein
VAVLVWEVGLLLTGHCDPAREGITTPLEGLAAGKLSGFPFPIMLTTLMLGAGLGSEFFYSGVPRALAGIGWVLLGYGLWSERGEDSRLLAAAR